MRILSITVAAFMMMALSSIAQPPDDRGGPWEYGRMAPPGGEPASPLHKIMEELREQDPERLEQLENLRRSDPQAFRIEARAIIHSTALQKLEKMKPEIYAAIIKLGQEDRDWLLDSIVKSKLFEHNEYRRHKNDPGNSRGDRKQLRELIKQYNKSESADEKRTIRAELKGYISAQYDQRLDMRTEQLREMEENISQVKRALEQAEHDKELFIEDKVKQILNGERNKGKRRGEHTPD